MSKRQCRQSTADPLDGEKQNHRPFPAEHDGIVKLVCRGDPGCSEVELQDSELSSPACNIYVCCNECGDKQAVTLVTSPRHVTSPLLRDVVQTTRAKILATPLIMYQVTKIIDLCNRPRVKESATWSMRVGEVHS